jgi:pimeloyl-ACP methyl ester carboxylesterase
MLVEANSVQIFCRKTGSGPPLVLLHGCTEDHRTFDRLAPGLSGSFSVYAVDSRNHGESTMTGDFSYATMADDTLALIGSLGLAPTDVVGFSDGAIIALLAAMKRPEAFRRLALLGVNLRPSDLSEVGAAVIRKMYEESRDPRLGNVLVEPDIDLADLAGVTHPVMLVAGEYDLFRPELFTEMAKAFPRAELLIMKGHDHVSYVIDQDILLTDLLRFFA